jgi:hypothetical protein
MPRSDMAATACSKDPVLSGKQFQFLRPRPRTVLLEPVGPLKGKHRIHFAGQAAPDTVLPVRRMDRQLAHRVAASCRPPVDVGFLQSREARRGGSGRATRSCHTLHPTGQAEDLWNSSGHFQFLGVHARVVGSKDPTPRTKDARRHVRHA